MGNARKRPAAAAGRGGGGGGARRQRHAGGGGAGGTSKTTAAAQRARENFITCFLVPGGDSSCMHYHFVRQPDACESESLRTAQWP